VTVSLPRRSRNQETQPERYTSVIPTPNTEAFPGFFDFSATATSTCFGKNIHFTRGRENRKRLRHTDPASQNGIRGEFCLLSKSLLFCNQSSGERTTFHPGERFFSSFGRIYARNGRFFSSDRSLKSIRDRNKRSVFAKSDPRSFSSDLRTHECVLWRHSRVSRTHKIVFSDGFGAGHGTPASRRLARRRPAPASPGGGEDAAGPAAGTAALRCLRRTSAGNHSYQDW